MDPKLVAGRNRLQEELRAMLSRVDANAAAKVAAARPASAPIRAAPRTPGPRADTPAQRPPPAAAARTRSGDRETAALQNAAPRRDRCRAEARAPAKRAEVAGASVTATADRERLIKAACRRHPHPPSTASVTRLSPTSHRPPLKLPFGPDLLARAVQSGRRPDGADGEARARAGEQDGEARHDALSAERWTNCIRT